MRSFVLAAAIVLSASSAHAFQPLVCEFPLKKETWLIDSRGMTPIQGDRFIRVELTKYRTIKSYDSWKIKDEKNSFVVITDRRTVRVINASNSAKPEERVSRGTCREPTREAQQLMALSRRQLLHPHGAPFQRRPRYADSKTVT